jgi:hypothetical protein
MLKINALDQIIFSINFPQSINISSNLIEHLEMLAEFSWCATSFTLLNPIWCSNVICTAKLIKFLKQTSIRLLSDYARRITTPWQRTVKKYWCIAAHTKQFDDWADSDRLQPMQQLHYDWFGDRVGLIKG